MQIIAFVMTENDSEAFENPAFQSPQWLYVVSGLYMINLITVGIVLNGAVLIAFLRKRRNFNRNSVFPTAIILNGLCMILLCFIFPTLAEFNNGFLNIFSFEVCVVEAFGVYVFGFGSILLNMSIAIYRYVMVTKPDKSLGVSIGHLLAVVAFCEGTAVLFALFPLFGWGSYGMEAHGTSCGLAWQDRTVNSFSYIVFIGIVSYAIPLVIIAYCYLQIFKTVSQYFVFHNKLRIEFQNI